MRSYLQEGNLGEVLLESLCQSFPGSQKARLAQRKSASGR